MSDQSEKIIHLAREMLRDGNDQATTRTNAFESQRRTSIKAAAFTALLTAFGSASLTHFVDEMRRPINRYERIEINALIYYAARENARTVADIQNDLERDLAVTSLEALSAAEYRRVRDYLRDKIEI